MTDLLLLLGAVAGAVFLIFALAFLVGGSFALALKWGDRKP